MDSSRITAKLAAYSVNLFNCLTYTFESKIFPRRGNFIGENKKNSNFVIENNDFAADTIFNVHYDVKNYTSFRLDAFKF